MTYAGLDIGSRTIVLVEFNEGLKDCAILDTGPDPVRRCQRLLRGKTYRRVVATGYGRHLATATLADEAVSEIRAYAVGARHLYPDCRTVIDVGGQDCKAALLSEEGDVRKFEMNDRCAAGTGRFLEVMARALELEIGQLGGHALSATRMTPVNSLCTVFAESEAVSLIARGEDSRTIALGLHEAIATRIAGMVRRVGIAERVVFAGGGALNACLRQLLSQKIGHELTVPNQPQIVGALGAALVAQTPHSVAVQSGSPSSPLPSA
jgi:(R)-2-hydroxyacyl-CoA dehydratese activating ATPase